MVHAPGGNCMEEIDLYCLPYAGGSARVIYSKWRDYLEAGINLIPLETAGHGERMNEKPYESIEKATEDLLGSMKDRISVRPYALYGHSMGTLLAFETALLAKKEGLPQPKVIFLSGRKPMHKTRDEKTTFDLPDEEFISEIVGIGGTPQEVFKYKQLRDVFLNMLRNDYRIVEQYKIRDRIESLNTDIVFFASDEDTLITREDVKEWNQYCDGSFEYHQYEGGHFFINDCYQDICEKINKKLISVMN